MKTLSLAMCLAALSYGQLNGPRLGYLIDESGVRPVAGIPAAAGVAPPLDLGRSFETIAASPNQEYFLAAATDSGEVLRINAGTARSDSTGAKPHPKSILFSPTGRAALLVFDGGTTQALIGKELRDVDFSFLGATPTAFAISDDGAWITALNESALWAAGPTGDMRRVDLDASGTSLAFAPNRTDLAIAATDRVMRLTDLPGRALVLTVASTPRTVGIAATADGRIIAAARDGAITVIQASGETQTLDCGCEPEGLFAMGRSVFRLTKLSDGAFKLFDASTSEVWFAPILEAPAQEGAAQ